jgi:hypothetical protein
MFQRYPHLEKLGNIEVEGIEFGNCHVFPKLDGANASIWAEEHEDDYVISIHFGSRNRELSLDNDNAGFMATMSRSFEVEVFLNVNPMLRLYGEWLVPHTLKDYRDDAWKKFYVFDVFNDETESFMTYEQYQPLMEAFKIDYIPCIKIIQNGTPDQFVHEVKNARYLLKDDAKSGEGIVIKNYSWMNKFKRQTWAKIIGGEFKDEFHKAWEPSLIKAETNELTIVEKAVTLQLVEKEYAKIVVSEGGWSSKYIPRLLETVFYCVVNEELYDAWKSVNYGTINGKALRNFTIGRVKQLKPELF